VFTIFIIHIIQKRLLKCEYLSRLTYAFTVLTLVVSLAILTGTAAADNANFVIQPQQKHKITLSLKETDNVSGSFSVVSDDDTGINFQVTDPRNTTILRYTDVKQKNFSFIAEAAGDYQLHFDNSVSANYEKTVALNYNVIHYIMGMPQEQFYFLFIAAVALIGILLYVVLMPR